VCEPSEAAIDVNQISIEQILLRLSSVSSLAARYPYKEQVKVANSKQKLRVSGKADYSS
jgi:hypothetical protein